MNSLARMVLGTALAACAVAPFALAPLQARPITHDEGVLPAGIQWRRSKVGFETPQSEWIRTSMRAALASWAAKPSEPLQQIVDRSRVESLAASLLATDHLHKMDENQFLFIRLFFLDRWLQRFDVQIPSQS